MKCKQIQSSFYDYSDDAMDQRTRSVIESHLSSCASCRLHYETQRSLHQGITNAVASELADLHFLPKTIKAELSNADRRSSVNAWARQMAYAMPAFLLLGIVLWPLLKPARELVDDPSQSLYSEAYRYLEMRGADGTGASSLLMPVAVIIQPGAQARVIELDGTTDISAELK
jgi:hypothetical protein